MGATGAEQGEGTMPRERGSAQPDGAAVAVSTPRLKGLHGDPDLSAGSGEGVSCPCTCAAAAEARCLGGSADGVWLLGALAATVK
jgi:hypothetical protein